MHQQSLQLEAVLDEFAPKLRELSEEETRERAGGQQGWSRREELGHLLDSATNNRVRFIHAALQGSYEGPTYEGNEWVRMGGYAGMPWTGLVDAWQHLNRLLVVAIRNIPDDRVGAMCRVGENEPATLQHLVEDYVHHMKEHLKHIIRRG